jgi:hypothetical protein
VAVWRVSGPPFRFTTGKGDPMATN